VDGQVNLRDAVNKVISYTNESGKSYDLNDKTAALFVRYPTPPTSLSGFLLSLTN
jgi:malate synthase